MNHVKARRDAERAVGTQRFDRAVEVIEGIEKVFRQRADGVDSIGIRLLLGSFLIIRELGTCPQGLIAQFVTLLF